jgi:hypothetical protein
MAVAAFFACVLAGVVLVVLDFDLIGIVVCLVSVPVALAAWAVTSDRS